jgi:hypothetical protein
MNITAGDRAEHFAALSGLYRESKACFLELLSEFLSTIEFK